MHFSTFHKYKGVFCQAVKVAKTETNFGAELFFCALKVLDFDVALIGKSLSNCRSWYKLIQQAAQLSAIWNVTGNHNKLQGGNSFS